MPRKGRAVEMESDNLRLLDSQTKSTLFLHRTEFRKTQFCKNSSHFFKKVLIYNPIYYYLPFRDHSGF